MKAHQQHFKLSFQLAYPSPRQPIQGSGVGTTCASQKSSPSFRLFAADSEISLHFSAERGGAGWRCGGADDTGGAPLHTTTRRASPWPTEAWDRPSRSHKRCTALRSAAEPPINSFSSGAVAISPDPVASSTPAAGGSSDGSAIPLAGCVSPELFDKVTPAGEAAARRRANARTAAAAGQAAAWPGRKGRGGRTKKKSGREEYGKLLVGKRV
jgi:hypothetical protein